MVIYLRSYWPKCFLGRDTEVLKNLGKTHHSLALPSKSTQQTKARILPSVQDVNPHVADSHPAAGSELLKRVAGRLFRAIKASDVCS